MTRTLIKRCLGLCVPLLIILAVVITLGREFAPQVSQYRLELEDFLSETMGVEVSIASIAASWRGFSPALRLGGVRVHGRDGEQILAVDKAHAGIDLLRSLLNWEVVLDRLEFVDVAMGFQQSAEGIWSLRGLDPSAVADGSIDINDPLDVFLLSDHIELRNARFTFDFRSGHHSEVALPHLVLENSGHFHRLRSELAVDRTHDVVTLIIEARGDPRNRNGFSAEGYLRLQQFELDKALAALPGRWWDGLPNQEWRKGHQLNLELWFDIIGGMASTRGRLDIGELPVDLNEAVAMPKRTTADFVGSWASNGAWRLALRDLSFAWDAVQSPAVDLLVTSTNLGEPVHLRTGELDLAQWFGTLRGAGLVKGEALEALEDLQPQGRLRNVILSVAGTRLEDLTLRANLDNVAVGSWRGAPAIRQANGYVEATPFAGFVDLASDEGFAMHYPTLYHQPFEFDSARGRVHWRIDTRERAVKVHSGLLSANGDMGEGRGYFSLFVPFNFGERPEELVLQLGLRDSHARYRQQFIPYILPDSLAGWLNDSIGDGRVRDGGFLYRGGLTRESARHAAVQLFLNVEEGRLAFHPDWPALEQAYGTVWLNDDTITGDLDSGRLLDTRITGGSVTVEPGHDDARALVLHVAGRGEGNAGDGLRLVRETPLAAAVDGDLLADWTVDGRMTTQVAFTLPLHADARPDVRRLDVALDSAQLATGDLNLHVDHIGGRLGYDQQRGLHAEQLTGQLWGNPVTVTVGSVAGDRDGQAVTLTLAGRASVAALNNWHAAPQLAFASGETTFSAALTVRGQSKASQSKNGQSRAAEPLTLTVQSDLRGIAIDLPAPFGKSAEQSVPLTIEVPLAHGGESRYAFHYGDFLRGEEGADGWHLTLDSAMVAGKAHIHRDPGRPATLALTHLRLPGAGPEAGAADRWAGLDPRTLPAMDVSVDTFAVGDEEYGQWSFQLRPTATGLVAGNIDGSIRGGRIIGLEAGKGAELYWDKVGDEVRSRFNGRFVTANLGSVLQQWHQPHLLDSESSRFDARLTWPGSPAAISLTALQGDMVMAIKRGTFIRGAGEATTGSALLDLIAFFNFDTWLRRLRLDFSDLTRAGTTFQTIDGALQFDQGKVHMNTPVVVNSASSRFQMAGVVDLLKSELDTKLVATIPVGSNLTFVAALAGMGLPAVAGMWLISKVFEEQIGKMSSLSFHVTGPLSDPDMDFVRLFDDQAVREDLTADAEG